VIILEPELKSNFQQNIQISFNKITNGLFNIETKEKRKYNGFVKYEFRIKLISSLFFCINDSIFEICQFKQI